MVKNNSAIEVEILRRKCLDEIHSQALDRIEYICSGSVYDALDYAYEYNAMLYAQEGLENYICNARRTNEELGSLLKKILARNEENEADFLLKVTRAFLEHAYYSTGCQKAAKAVVESIAAEE